MATPEPVPDKTAPEISRISMKVPPFWKTNPALWFSQVESQFHTAGITSQATKYHTIVASIESSILTHVSDIILGPEDLRTYSTLKNRLIQQYADSEQMRLRKLLQDISLDDKKPSQLLREMRELADATMSEDLLKSLWTQRLPAQTKAILTTHNANLLDLASLADRINEVTENVCVESVVKPKDNSIQHLEQKIAELSQQIASLQYQDNRHRNRSRSRSLGPHVRSRSISRDTICYYHQRFGSEARKCHKPCTMSTKNSENYQTSR